MDASPPQLSGPQRAGDGWGDETPTGGGGGLLYGKTSMAAQPLKDRQQRGPGGRKEAEGPPKVGPLPLQAILVSAGLPGQSRRREAARISGRDRFWREGPVTAGSQIRVLRKKDGGGRAHPEPESGQTPDENVGLPLAKATSCERLFGKPTAKG